MCGIVGVLSGDAKEMVARGDFFHQALYADALRGWDSTGVFSVGISKQPVICKKAMTAADFLTHKSYEDIMRAYASADYIIGHNRKATRGGVNNNNAHPFSYGKITMVHNGTLDNHRTLPDGNNFVVDSEAFVNGMNVLGAVDTLEHVTGAFAVVWHDAQHNTVSICRNEERPLSYAYCKDSDTVLIASELFMLMWLAQRNKLTLESTHVLEPGRILTFHREDLHNPAETLIKLAPAYNSKWFDRDYPDYGYAGQTGSNAKKARELREERKKEKNKSQGKAKGPTASSTVIALPEAATRKARVEQALKTHGLEIGQQIIFDCMGFRQYNAGSPKGVIDGLVCIGKKHLTVEAHGMEESDYVEEGMFTSKLQAIRAGLDPHNDVCIVEKPECIYDPKDDTLGDVQDARFHGPNNTLVSKDKFLELVKTGCAWCGDDISPEDSEHISWANYDKDPICESCTADANTVGGIDGALLN